MVFSGNDISDSYNYVLRSNRRRINSWASDQQPSSGFVIWALQHSYGARLGLIVARIVNLHLGRSSEPFASMLAATPWTSTRRRILYDFA